MCDSYLFLLKLYILLFYYFLCFIISISYTKEPLKYSLVGRIVVCFASFVAFYFLLVRELQESCLYFQPMLTRCSWARNALWRLLCLSVLSLALLTWVISSPKFYLQVFTTFAPSNSFKKKKKKKKRKKAKTKENKKTLEILGRL